MLRKLVKYDLKANWMYFLIMYGVFAVYSVLFFFLLQMDPEDLRVQITLFSAVAAYVFMIAALSIMTTVLIVARFYKNMFGPEGYLTHTLPVSPAVNLASKVISAVIWNVLTMLVCLGSVCLVAGSSEVGEEIWWVLKEFALYYDGQIFGLYCVSAVLNLFTGIFVMYLAICLGQLANRHRVLCAIGYYLAYVAINYVLQMAGSIVVSLFAIENESEQLLMVLNEGLTIGISFVFLIVSVFASHYIIARKLNLE